MTGSPGGGDPSRAQRPATARLRRALLSAALLASSAGAADPASSLAEIPVVSMEIVAPGRYEPASRIAATGGTPLDIALAAAGEFEGSLQQIIQANEGAEAPSASRVTILRDGLPDDSIRGERWEVALERTGTGPWRIREVKRAWRCRRGEPRERFAMTPCP